MPLRETAPTGAPCWIDLFSSDTDAARAFYGELFGWKSESAGDEYGGYINFTREDVPVAGCMHNDGTQGTPDGWTIYLASDDIQATVDAAAANGGQVFVPPMDVMELGKMSVLADVGGAAVGVWQPGLHKGFGVLAEIGSPAWFELLTRDHAGSVKFYEDVFGWDTDSKGDTDEFRYTTLGRGDDQLAGIMDATTFLPAGVPAFWSVYFLVENTEAALARIGELGGATVMGPDDSPFGVLAQATDPTGAMFKIVSPI